METSAPEYLSQAGKDKWKELANRLGELSPNDYDALALLAGSWQTYLEARENVDSEGMTLESALNGRAFVNPAVNVMNEAWKQIVNLSKAFGIAPTPRAAAPKAANTEAEDMLQIMNGG